MTVMASSTVLPVLSSADECAQALAFSLASLQKDPASVAAVESPSHSRSRSSSFGDETETTPDNDMASNASDLVKRLARCRERNREHARRTRIRKKVHIEALQQKCKGLQAEQANLKRILEDRRVASILLNLSGNADPSEQQQQSQLDDMSAPGVDLPPPSIVVPDHEDHRIKEKRNSPHSNSLTITIDGVPTVFCTKSHVNWKTGTYTDGTGEQKRLDVRQLESLRRERNRLHAKMTRDRKKCFLFNIQREIDELERENQRLRQLVDPVVISPELTSSQLEKNTPHGFVLDT